ncbi:Hypothetical_protein [Hexamita inflata]|uniref:Hypothetical_protein n=1 Tax=Hexamita inflata TaxID=28002 RepID=A0AA86QAU0_9EUKA|nr:Hypothetical protein HINF_LOCUS37149 [Hexamita inflata]
MQQPKLQIYFFNSCIVIAVSTSPENILFREITKNLLYLEQCGNTRKKSMEKILVKIYLYMQFQYNSNPRQFLSRMGTLGRLLLKNPTRNFSISEMNQLYNGYELLSQRQVYFFIVGREKKLLQTQKLIQQLVKAINPANQVDEILLKKYVDAVNDLLGLRINPLSIIHHKKETDAFLNDQELLTFYEIRHIEVYYFLKICQCLVVSEADVERLFSYLKRTTGNHIRQRMSVDTYKWLCYIKIHNSNKITEEDDIEFLPGM